MLLWRGRELFAYLISLYCEGSYFLVYITQWMWPWPTWIDGTMRNYDCDDMIGIFKMETISHILFTMCLFTKHSCLPKCFNENLICTVKPVLALICSLL